MALTLIPSQDGKYITMKINGEINRKLAIEYDNEAHALGKKLGINIYLMDLTESKNTDTVIENYSFAYDDVREQKFDKAALVVLLVAEDDHSHDFIETVSQNAGLNVVLFRDRVEAERYIRNFK